MKTNDFIRLLQQEDPDNECDVCVGNDPVSWIESLPYYYDGRQTFVERVDSHPIRGGFPFGTRKLKIHYDTLEDALMENPEMELDLSGITYEGKVDSRHKEYLDEWIKQGREFQEWSKKYAEARKNGTEPPPICENVSAPTLKAKLGKWLKSMGIIE